MICYSITKRFELKWDELDVNTNVDSQIFFDSLLDLLVTFSTILFIAVLFTRRIPNESVLWCLG